MAETTDIRSPYDWHRYKDIIRKSINTLGSEYRNDMLRMTNGLDDAFRQYNYWASLAKNRPTSEHKRKKEEALALFNTTLKVFNQHLLIARLSSI